MVGSRPMQVVVQFLTDPIVAGILTLLGAVTTLGDFLKLWDFGPLSLLRWIRARINQAFWSVPKETLRIIPMDRPWPWGPASIQGRPAMQVVMDFYFTNITTEPALVVGTHLTAYYERLHLNATPGRAGMKNACCQRQHQSATVVAWRPSEPATVCTTRGIIWCGRRSIASGCCKGRFGNG